MRKLIVNTFATLDGVMQAPGGPQEDPTGGFGHGGWSVPYWDEVMMQVMGEATSRPFAMVLGRRTYEIMAAHWPHASEEAGAAVFNNAPKYVVSTTLDRADWQNSTIIRGVPADLERLKDEDGPELQVHGSAALIQSLLEHDLVDEMRVWIFPVVLGTGKRLFADGTPPRSLRLIDSKVSTSGVIITTYEPAGAVRTGSFALEEPSAEELERRARL